MPRLVYITTSPIALRNLCEGQLAYFRDHGYEVIAVSAPGADLDFVRARDGIQAVAIPMEREIRPLRDLVSLWRLWRLMRRMQPDIVTTATSKAGLLGLLAAWLARVPVRVYQLWGLRLETLRGFKRSLLAAAERICVASSQRVFCVSDSLREAFLAGGFAQPEKVVVLCHGSSNGVAADRFTRTDEVQEGATRLRKEWGVPDSAPVIGFVGRFVRDKGITELVDAFERIAASRDDVWLLLVGDYETGDPVPQEYVRRIAEHPRIIRPGYVRELTPYYAAMTVLAFPSHREGFPNVVLEAAAAEVPVVAFRATGAIDAVEDGVTGTIVALGDRELLSGALLMYLNDSALRLRHGRAGRERVLRDFRREPIWAAMDAHFRELLGG